MLRTWTLQFLYGIELSHLHLKPWILISISTMRAIDTHLHLWDPRQLGYTWLRGIALLDRPYLVEDYGRACAGLGIEAMAFMECVVDAGQFEGEARFVEGQAKQDPRIKALVAQADCAQGARVAASLERLKATTPLLRGVRQNIEAQPDPEFCLRPAFIEGVKSLTAVDLHFEICANYRHMRAVTAFAEQVSEVRLMLDHCGKPNIRGREIEPWRSEMQALAALPNVHCKVSGLMTEANLEHWTDEDIRPYIDATVEAFGFERVVFGSDWPVCLLAGTLGRWMEVLERCLRGADTAKLERFYRLNAIDFYRLGGE